MSEWATASLGQLIDLVYGAALADGDRSGSGYPVFGSNGVVGVPRPSAGGRTGHRGRP